MNHTESHITQTVLTAVVAVLLQLILAPNLTIAGVTPNFLLIAVVLSALRLAPLSATVLGFILGLLFDFMTQGPMGCMSLILTVLGFAVSSVNKGSFTGGLLVNLVILLLGALAGEFLNSVVYAVLGINPEFLLSLLVKVLPGALYDSFCGLLVLLIAYFVTGNHPNNRNLAQGRPLHRKFN